jgi:antirestriction protein ArdC
MPLFEAFRDAESDSATLAHELTPEPRPEHSAYSASWLKVLKEDKRAIFSAAAPAQRAADCLAGLQPAAEQAEQQAA